MTGGAATSHTASGDGHTYRSHLDEEHAPRRQVFRLAPGHAWTDRRRAPGLSRWSEWGLRW